MKTLKVVHIALEDVSAGYDIQSYNENREKIYIEVKAVIKLTINFTYLQMNTISQRYIIIIIICIYCLLI